MRASLLPHATAHRGLALTRRWVPTSLQQAIGSLETDTTMSRYPMLTCEVVVSRAVSQLGTLYKPMHILCSWVPSHSLPVPVLIALPATLHPCPHPRRPAHPHSHPAPQQKMTGLAIPSRRG